VINVAFDVALSTLKNDEPLPNKLYGFYLVGDEVLHPSWGKFLFC
jgi:hypothetical protein